MPKDISTKERILQSALSLFAAKGFDGISLRAIAEHAQVANQLLVYYFKDKESLWFSVAEWADEQAKQRKIQLANSYQKNNAKDAFRQYISISIQQLFLYPELAKMLFWEATQNTVRYQKIYAQLIEPEFNKLMQVITLMQQQGVIQTKIPAQHFTSIFQAIIMQRVFTDNQTQQLTKESLSNKNNLNAFVDSLYQLMR